MNQHHDHTWKFALIYGVLAFVALFAILATVLAFNVNRSAATKTEVRKSLGASNVVTLAKQEIQKEAGSVGYLVTKQTLVSVKQDRTSASVVLKVTLVNTASGTTEHYKLRVKFTKSLYTVQGVAQA
jgi:hypothetical protein